MKKILLSLVYALSLLICITPPAFAQVMPMMILQTPFPPGPPVATLRFEQGVCSVTSAAVIQPSLQVNACSGAGTPSWVSNLNTYYCVYSVGTTGNLNWTASTTGTPVTGIGVAAQVWAGPGIYSINGRFNLLNFKMIATSATVSVQISCGY